PRSCRARQCADSSAVRLCCVAFRPPPPSPVPPRFILAFFFHDTATTQLSTLSLHDALPILSFISTRSIAGSLYSTISLISFWKRSEEHTSELQSRFDLVCRLLPEKKKGHGDLCSQSGTRRAAL